MQISAGGAEMLLMVFGGLLGIIFLWGFVHFIQFLAGSHTAGTQSRNHAA